MLDRDGVINDNQHPVNRPEELTLFPGAASAIARLNQAGLLVCVATNQGGVGLGYMTEEALNAVHARMRALLAESGARIDALQACIHPPDAGCACRKPQPGMLLALQRELGFSAADSFMVGDRETDVEAGMAAGMRTIRIGPGATAADFQAADLPAAVAYILRA